ncbi:MULTISPECIES: hypothetical protein [Carnobacterium]|uniref:hypothetical protein n=1 Tax=Carnobacterium TaxID=2747 RepID=UPI00165BCDE9|nr:hypothetical protein [Carnobacterium maltaromaticum]MBC9787533.1 hypothetical protein [Carnobacterium maltaromaticum]
MSDPYGMQKQQEEAAKEREKKRKENNKKEREKHSKERSGLEKKVATKESKIASLEENLTNLQTANVKIHGLWDAFQSDVMQKIATVSENETFIEPDYAGHYTDDLRSKFKSGIKSNLDNFNIYLNGYKGNYESIEKELNDKITDQVDALNKLKGRVLQLTYLIDTHYAD